MSNEAENLLNPTETLMIDITAAAYKLKKVCADKLEPLPPGIYARGRWAPLVKANTELFVFSQTSGKYEKIKDLMDVKKPDHVFNSDGEIVIPRFMMADKERMLSSEPTMPYAESLVTKAYCETLIENINPFKTCRYNNTMYRLFKHEYADFHEIDSGFSEAVRVMRDEVFSFIGRDNWHVYFVRLSEDMLVIDKTTDYRIQQYYVMLAEKNQTDPDQDVLDIYGK